MADLPPDLSPAGRLGGLAATRQAIGHARVSQDSMAALMESCLRDMANEPRSLTVAHLKEIVHLWDWMDAVAEVVKSLLGDIISHNYKLRALEQANAGLSRRVEVAEARVRVLEEQVARLVK